MKNYRKNIKCVAAKSNIKVGAHWKCHCIWCNMGFMSRKREKKKKKSG